MTRRLIAGIAAVFWCTTALAQNYTFDSRHTMVTWATSHWGLSTYRGKFFRNSGKVTLDRTASAGSLEVTIDASAQLSGEPGLDKHLASEDFLHVVKFPTITFRSNRMRFDGGVPVAVEGELTLLGIARPVTLTITNFRCIEHPRIKGKEICGSDATTTIRRSDFGMKYAVPAVGDDVTLQIQVEAFKD